jgi:peptidoglycan/xylan/chitin deacetylase (PgdA/CDA1 family)
MDYILEAKENLSPGHAWDTYTFVQGIGNPTRRSVTVEGSAAYFRVSELPSAAVGGPVMWGFTPIDLVTGSALASNQIMQCTGYVYFAEKTNVVLTGTNWFRTITHTYDSAGRKEGRIDVLFPGGATHKEWAVMVTNVFTNAILNEGFESGPSNAPSYWVKGGFGNNTRTHSIVAGRSGQRAAEVTMSDCINGDVRWQPTNVPVVPDGRYRMSFWHRSSVSNNVTVQCILSDGSSRFLGIALPPPAPDWTYREYMLTMPSNAVTAIPYIALTTNGALIIDDVKLVKLSDRSALDEGMITFYIDDGWKITGTNVASVLEKYEYRGAFAIVTDRVGLSGVFTWAELLALQSNGHSIVAHSMDHSDMAAIDQREMIRQVNYSRKILLSKGVRPVESMVYPFGSRSTFVDGEVRDAGYRMAVGTESGYNLYGNYNPFALKRMTIYSTTTVAEVKGWIDEAKAQKKWLMVAWHHVGDGDTSSYSWPKSSVEEVVAYARSQNLRGISPEDGLNLLAE